MLPFEDYILKAVEAALLAGKEILEVYSRDFDVTLKEDKSPLTEADRNAHDKIASVLGIEIPILSEEGKSIPYSERKNWQLFWLVDPLDGTKEFIKRNGEFTVNIALIEKGKAIAGVIYAPVMDLLYFGSTGTGSYKIQHSLGELTNLSGSLDQLIHASKKLPCEKRDLFTVVASRSHLTPETDEYIKSLKEEHGTIAMISKGSSLKLCLVAEGSADTYPRFAPTMEWDTAAGHAIAKFAGCSVFDSNTLGELMYNKENLLNPWFVVVRH